MRLFLSKTSVLLFFHCFSLNIRPLSSRSALSSNEMPVQTVTWWQIARTNGCAGHMRHCGTCLET